MLFSKFFLKGWKTMFNFFADENAKQNSQYIINGADYNHIKNVLRMKAGGEFLVSCGGISSLCRLDSYEGDSAVAEIIEEVCNTLLIVLQSHNLQKHFQRILGTVQQL